MPAPSSLIVSSIKKFPKELLSLLLIRASSSQHDYLAPTIFVCVVDEHPNVTLIDNS
jgi:hypothetical protein